MDIPRPCQRRAQCKVAESSSGLADWLADWRTGKWAQADWRTGGPADRRTGGLRSSGGLEVADWRTGGLGAPLADRDDTFGVPLISLILADWWRTGGLADWRTAAAGKWPRSHSAVAQQENPAYPYCSVSAAAVFLLSGCRIMIVSAVSRPVRCGQSSQQFVCLPHGEVHGPRSLHTVQPVVSRRLSNALCNCRHSK